MASVSLIINWRDYDEYVLDTPEFDAMPRAGEEIMLTEGVDMRKPATHAIAVLRVTRVVYDMRVGYTTSVHAWAYVEPVGDALQALDLLYPAEEDD